MTDNANQRVTLTFDVNGNIVENSQFNNLSTEKKQSTREFVGNVISSQSSAIGVIKEFTKLPNGSFATAPLLVVEVPFSYLNYRDQQRATNPNHQQTLADEIGAAFNSVANTFIVSGPLSISTGSAILALDAAAPPLGFAISGSIIVGWVANSAYDNYLKDDVNVISNYLADRFFDDKLGSVSIANDSKSQTTLNYTPIPGTTLSNSQAQQKAIELLNNLSGGQILDQTSIPQKIVVNSSSQAGANSSTYTIQPGDSISSLASSLGTTIQKLIDANPWLISDHRISADGKYILIKVGEKLTLSASDITNSVKLENVTVKNANGSDGGTFTNLFLDKANNILLTNTELNSKWQSSIATSLNNTKIEFDFDSFVASQVSGTGSKNWDGHSIINNSLLNLTINTDKLKDFAADNNSLNQTGNVIGDADWQATMPINVINGDGYKNVVSAGIVSDGFRPGNQELSSYFNFNTQLNADFSRLDNLANQLNRANQNQSFTDISKLNLQLQNPLANLTNNFINARTFLNIDPVVLDLNGDGVKLTSYQNSEVTFDVDNDGKQERTGWVSNQDGILVDDKNHNGKIDNITETISEYYNPNDGSVADDDGKYSSDGLAALKKLDSNHDGKFNNQDAKWNDLKIWVDANGNGVTDAGELKTLNEAGIKEFDLTNIIQANKERNEGNVILAKATYTTTDNQIKQVAAVDFTTNPIGYEFNDVNLGKLATAEDGTKSLVISDTNGATVTASNETAQNIFGNVGNDTIIGDARDNWISGGLGSDTLKGGDGDDILIIDSEDKQENIDGVFALKKCAQMHIFSKKRPEERSETRAGVSCLQVRSTQTRSVNKKRTAFLAKSNETLLNENPIHYLKTKEKIQDIFDNDNFTKSFSNQLIRC